MELTDGASVLDCVIMSRFLLAEFQLCYVLEQYEPREMEEALQSLPITLEDAYRDIMQRIEERGSGLRRLALKALFWILKAARPLRVEELCELLVIRKGDTDVQNRYRLAPQLVVDACESLVVYDQEVRFIRFTHFTIKEYLRTYDFGRYLDPLPSLAETCLTYLAFDEFCKGPLTLPTRFGLPGGSLMEQRLEKYKACHYVACCWDFHTKEEDSPDIKDLVLRVLANKSVRDSMVQLVKCESIHANKLHPTGFPEGRTLLHTIAEAGLGTLCVQALWGIQTPNIQYVHP